MINKHDIAKALLNKARQVASDNSYLLIPDGESYEPDLNATYIQEKTLYGDDNSIGLADASSDIQFGIYQINVNTPKSDIGGKWSGLKIADIYQLGFAKGTELTFGGQMLRIKNTSIREMEQMKTHFTHILSAEFSVIA
jgi:hypothetical protein